MIPPKNEFHESINPELDAELLRIATANAKKKAYHAYQELHDLEDKYEVDVQTCFCNDGETRPLPKSMQMKHAIRVGTDCSGIETPLIALDNMGIPYQHVFSCDNDANVQKPF